MITLLKNTKNISIHWDNGTPHFPIFYPLEEQLETLYIGGNDKKEHISSDF
jgi:hypothetical protein